MRLVLITATLLLAGAAFAQQPDLSKSGLVGPLENPTIVTDAAQWPKQFKEAPELAALVQERCFYALEAPIERVTGWDTPYPHSLEWAYFPGPVRLTQALKRVMEA